MTNSLFASFSLIAGLGIPAMVAINSSLGVKLNSPNAAVVILFFTGLCLSILVFMLSEPNTTNKLNDISPVYFIGGAIVVLYIVAVTWVAPQFGVGSTIFFVLLGQLLSAAIIDHYGLFGAPKYSIDYQRVLGIIVMSIGVFLAQKH